MEESKNKATKEKNVLFATASSRRCMQWTIGVLLIATGFIALGLYQSPRPLLRAGESQRGSPQAWLKPSFFSPLSTAPVFFNFRMFPWSLSSSPPPSSPSTPWSRPSLPSLSSSPFPSSYPSPPSPFPPSRPPPSPSPFPPPPSPSPSSSPFPPHSSTPSPHYNRFSCLPPPPPSLPPLPWRTGLGERVFDPSQLYLYYPRHGNDFMVGVSHRAWSLRCMAGEALLLRRILVLDTAFGVPGKHNDGKTLIKKVELYFDVTTMREIFPVIDLPIFLEGWRKWKTSHSGNNVSVFNVPIKGGPSFEEFQQSNATIIRYKYLNDWDYAFETCTLKPNIKRPCEVFQFAPSLTNIAMNIVEDLKPYFVAIHVRRGDKIKDELRWPHLDNDTRPPHLLEVLNQRNVSNETTIYICSDEREIGFFAPLLEQYRKVKMLRDYLHLWAPESEWWNATKGVIGEGDEPFFDGQMAGIVDYTIMTYGDRFIETFNDLTADKKSGVRA